MQRLFRLLTLVATLSVAEIIHAQESIRLTDVVKSTGIGRIDIMKDLTAEQLEALRTDNGGAIVIGVDVNESASGTEKSASQAVTLGTLTLTVDYSDGSRKVFDLADGCCSTQTQALVAENPSTERRLFYTLLGETGSSRITAGNQIQSDFDSTIRIDISDPLYDPVQQIDAVSVIMDIAWLETNVSLGDPEAFYDFTNGFEDLAVLNAVDTAFLDEYQAGVDEAVAVIETNPSPSVDAMKITIWNYFPSATSYFLAAYEDQYPRRGDYDFNDLTVAYQVRLGLNAANEIISIRGTAYLITRGAAYNHDWHLRISTPSGVNTSTACTTFLDPNNAYDLQDCSDILPDRSNGEVDMAVFSRTAEIFVDDWYGKMYTNTIADRRFLKGPKSEFRIDFDQPVRADAISEAPYDPYLFVRDTGESIQLLQVNPAFTDTDGYPYGMLMPSGWLPPLEKTSIRTAYPLFESFVASEGVMAADWYNTSYSEFLVPQPDDGVWAW